MSNQNVFFLLRVLGRNCPKDIAPPPLHSAKKDAPLPAYVIKNTLTVT